MTARPLRSRERQAIDDILTQAESEFLLPAGQPASIRDIDWQCKSLWPDWDPTPTRHSPPKEPPTPMSPAEDMDALKQQVRRLMERISGTAEGRHSSSRTEEFIRTVKDAIKKPDPPVPTERSKSERALSAETERDIRAIEEENRKLRRELQELKRSYDQSQTEIAELKKALIKSEAVRDKMTNRRREARTTASGRARPQAPLRK
jgi:hypothetical protein